METHHRRICLGMLLILFLALFGLAEEKTVTQRHVTGELKYVDVEKKAVVVQVGKLTVGAEVDPSATILVHGKRGSLADLNVGDQVSLSYERNDRVIAKSIRTGAAAKSQPAAKEP